MAETISCILHPVLMPAVGLMVLFNSGTYLSYLTFDAKKIVFLIVILCTLIIPLSLIPFFLYQKMIMNTYMNERRERIIPMTAGFLLYIFCYYLVKRIPIPTTYHAFILAGSMAILVAAVITYFWKISAHMIGVGGLTGLITYLIWSMKADLQFFLILAVLASGLAGFARLQLNIHDPPQVYTGFLAGFFTVGLTMLLY